VVLPTLGTSAGKSHQLQQINPVQPILQSLPGILCWLLQCPEVCVGLLSLCLIHQSCLLCILIYRNCFVLQALCTSSLDNGELWLQVEEAGNVVQSCKKFLQSHSSQLAAELLDDASILLSKHIHGVIAALLHHSLCCSSCLPQNFHFDFVLLQQA